MSHPDVSIGFEATGDLVVEYGPLRIAAAKYYQKNPADITGDDIARFQMED
jgi:hypothetical protein